MRQAGHPDSACKPGQGGEGQDAERQDGEGQDGEGQGGEGQGGEGQGGDCANRHNRPHCADRPDLLTQQHDDPTFSTDPEETARPFRQSSSRLTR
jgi:hypothetical protein